MVSNDPIDRKVASENGLGSGQSMNSQQETISLVSRPMPLQVRAGLVIGTCVAAHLLNRFPGTFRGPIRGVSGYSGRGKRSRPTPRSLDDACRKPTQTKATCSSQEDHDAQTSLVLVTTNREGAPAVSGAPRRGLPSDVGFDSR